jgi:N6-L-threonylcarbamoyladenine synthase
MIILAIETSCDETGVAILKTEGDSFSVLANSLHSQIEIHKETRGVVPEVAARQHVQMMPLVFEDALRQANISLDEINAVAVTHGPGLNGSLLVGIETAKTLAYSLQKPIIGINHLKAHLVANYFNTEKEMYEEMTYPALGLLVSGGHTELVLIKSATSFEIIGQTLDDAVGESFDKVAAQLGLEYPGGPQVSKRAELGNVEAFDLPIALKDSKELNFSYSGLKTAVRQLVEKGERTDQYINDICASFQKAAIGQLIHKTNKALEQYGIKTLCVAGGVSANQELRRKLQELADSHGIFLKVPSFHLCTDNALMIAMAAAFEVRHDEEWDTRDTWETITSIPNLNF